MALLCTVRTLVCTAIRVRPCTYSGWLAWRRPLSFLLPSLPLYREKLSYHANPCTAGNTSGQRFPYGDIPYLSVSGEKKRGRRAEKRSFETRDPLDRDASACMRAVTYRRCNDDTESWRILRKRDPEKTRAIIIFGECRSNDTSFETSLIDCVEN